MAIAELNQRLSDVSFELDVLPATFAALVRISLASGSGLALLSFLLASGESQAMRAAALGVTAVAGLLGAGTVAFIGRAAKARAWQIRTDWDTSSRDIGKRLGTGLAAAGSSRRSNRPNDGAD